MEEIIIDKERVNKVLNNIIDDEKMFELAEVFKLFGDTTRMKIFCALKEVSYVFMILHILQRVHNQQYLIN